MAQLLSPDCARPRLWFSSFWHVGADLACAIVESASQQLLRTVHDSHGGVTDVDALRDGALAALRLLSRSAVVHAGLSLSLERDLVPARLPQLITPWYECVRSSMDATTLGRIPRGKTEAIAHMLVTCVAGVALTARIQHGLASSRGLETQLGNLWIALRPELLRMRTP